MKVTYLKNTDPYNEYNDDSSIVTEEIVALDDENLLSLLQQVLGVLNHDCRKKAKKTATEVIKQYTNLRSPEELKVLDSIKIKGNQLLFPLGISNAYEVVDIANVREDQIQKIADWQLSNPSCFIHIETPKDIQAKIEAYKKQKEKKSKEMEKKRKMKELEKARKLLKDAGEKV